MAWRVSIIGHPRMLLFDFILYFSEIQHITYPIIYIYSIQQKQKLNNALHLL